LRNIENYIVFFQVQIDLKEKKVRVTRLHDAPIITPGLHPSIGENIQGPSLIRVPEWVEHPLGVYYLYFADHKGSYIRLAYADDLTGPWTVHVPGSLQLADSHFPTEQLIATEEDVERIRARWAETKGAVRMAHDMMTEITTPHIASPDVHIDDKNKEIIMYYHGLIDLGVQVSRVATSKNGIDFQAHPEPFAKSYLRIFKHEGYFYGMAMPGQFYRSVDGISGFKDGPVLFNKNMRHAGLLKRGNTLFVFWTQVGDVPEHIMVSTIDLSGDWQNWEATEGVEVLRPEHLWEGADAPMEPSIRSVAYGQVNQLRDPAIYLEGDRVYLLYAVGGESGIAIAEVAVD